MILKHYGLREQPFGATPDPQFLYASKMHREALASLLYAVESGRGFTALIAPPGLGKTTLLFHLLGSLRGKAKTAFVFQTQCKPRELLRFLLKEFGVTAPSADFVAMHHALNDMLAAEALAGRKCVIVLDEAHNLSDSVLESVRLLSDFETPNRKLLHIVMAGQSELKHRLSQPSLAQLRQRIGVVCKIGPLPAREIDEYIQHRLKAAGYSGPPLFTPAAMAVIREFSRGIPRNINALCFSAMSLGFALGRTELDAQILEEAVADLSLEDFDNLTYMDEAEIKDFTAQPRPPSETRSETTSANEASLESCDQPEDINVTSFSAAAGPQPQTAVQSIAVNPVEAPDRPEDVSEQVAAAATSQAPETKTDPQPTYDPLQNIDLSTYALLDGIPARKKALRGEDDRGDQSSPGTSLAGQRIVAPEPELDVLKKRLANRSYPEQTETGGMRNFVIIGLVAAVFGAALLAVLFWVRPNIGFAMGTSQPEPPTTAASRPITPAKVEVARPKQAVKRREVTPVLVTSTAVTLVRPHRNSSPVPIEETAPPELPLNDPASVQQIPGVVAPAATRADVAETSLAENENVNTPIEMTPPVYPESAKREKLEGTVVLQIVVDQNGKVKRLDRLTGDPQLADAAIQAVSRWRYRPAVVNGLRVESFKQVELKFSLGEGNPNFSPQQSTQ